MSTTNGSFKGISKDASPTTNYCQYLGSLVTALDRVARIPKLILGVAIKHFFYCSVAGMFAVATMVLAGEGNNRIDTIVGFSFEQRRFDFGIIFLDTAATCGKRQVSIS